MGIPIDLVIIKVAWVEVHLRDVQVPLVTSTEQAFQKKDKCKLAVKWTEDSEDLSS